MSPSLNISTNSIALSVPSLNEATMSATDDQLFQNECMDVCNYETQLKTSW